MNYIQKLQLTIHRAFAKDPDLDWHNLLLTGFEHQDDVDYRIKVNKELRVVLKLSYFSNPIRPTNAVPTQLIYAFGHTRGISFAPTAWAKYAIVLQPLCRMKPTPKQLKGLITSFEGWDVHAGNVCKFRGKPALFDW